MCEGLLAYNGQVECVIARQCDLNGPPQIDDSQNGYPYRKDCWFGPRERGVKVLKCWIFSLSRVNSFNGEFQQMLLVSYGPLKVLSVGKIFFEFMSFKVSEDNS